MRIALFGGFGVGNFGNDASLEATLQFLHRAAPSAELVCVCYCPEDVSANYQVNAIPIVKESSDIQRKKYQCLPRWIRGLFIRLPAEIVSWATTFWYLRKFDALIIPGTGILDDFCESPLAMPYNLFRWCLAAKLAGAKVMFIGVGAGPIRVSWSRKLMSAAARVADYRSYRDQTSKDFMIGLNVGTSADTVCPDIAFGLLAEGAGSTSCIDSELEESLEVAIGMMAYHGWRGGSMEIYDLYLEKMVTFVEWLLGQNHRVRLLIGDRVDIDAVESLRASIAKHQSIESKEQLIIEPVCSFDDVVGQMTKADIVVATRYHNIVCALMLAKPTISIGYAKKNDVLMAEMGLGEFCQHIEQMNVSTLIEQFDYLARHRAEVVQRVQTQAHKSKLQVEAHFASIFTEYLSPSLEV